MQLVLKEKIHTLLISGENARARFFFFFPKKAKGWGILIEISTSDLKSLCTL